MNCPFGRCARSRVIASFRDMNTVATFSNDLADAVDSAAQSVVQVQRHKAPVSGVVHSAGVVISNARALGGEDGVVVRVGERSLDAELHGWDPATGLAVLRVPNLDVKPIAIAKEPPRVGHFAVAVARSFGDVTASSGIISIVGGPFRTRSGRTIAEVIHTSAARHEGFVGAAFCNSVGELAGIVSGAYIRGLRAVVPVRLAWAITATLLQHGRMRRGYLGVAGQQAQVGDRPAMLISRIFKGSPADEAGLLVGDAMIAVDGHPVESPEDLIDLLTHNLAGRRIRIDILRGGEPKQLEANIKERSSN